jgi:probable phosphoglycerate mutase
MNILLIRHALPLQSAAAQSADPELGEPGKDMARRLPDALQRHQVTKIVSSPQLRARQTAAPLAEKLGLAVGIDDRLAEYDRDLQCYTPVEQLHAEDPAALRRLLSGHLPDGVDVEAFRARVIAAVRDVIGSALPGDNVAVISHGGVINVVLQSVLNTPQIFPFAIDYVSITQLRYSRSGRATVMGVNAAEHVWDLLPRNRRG